MFDVFLFFIDPGSGGCVFWWFDLLYMFVDLYPDHVVLACWFADMITTMYHKLPWEFAWVTLFF